MAATKAALGSSDTCAWYSARSDGRTCAPTTLASNMLVYDQGLSLLFRMCSSCSNLWRNILCAASFDTAQASFVRAPPLKYFGDITSLAKPATLLLSADLAEKLLLACKDEPAPASLSSDSRHTVSDAFSDSASKFAEWMGQGRLKLLRCTDRRVRRQRQPQAVNTTDRSTDTCLTAPLEIKVTKSMDARQGLTTDILKAANPDLKIYDYCRTEKNEPNYLRDTAVQLVVVVGGLWIGWFLCAIAAKRGMVWVTDSVVFAFVGVSFGIFSRADASNTSAAVAEQAGFNPSTVMFWLLPPILMAEVRRHPASQLLLLPHT